MDWHTRAISGHKFVPVNVNDQAQMEWHTRAISGHKFLPVNVNVA